jgi:uncharacterized membrane protein YphA (DoxX/SURF4 family)
MKQFFFGSTFTGNKVFNSTWLLFRFYIGFTIAIGAGWPKMNAITAPGWFVNQVSDLGFTFPSPAFWAGAAAWGEFVGGLCIAIGFFTRFSALQLAVQFFVVSFIWYNEPAPFVGMYYQQLLFWGFVLIAVSGAGRFSIDHWIMSRKSPAVAVKQFASVAAIAFLVFSTTAFTQKQEPQLSVSDLHLLRGTWNGTLTYRDYTSGKEETIPVTIYGWLKGDESNSRTWRLKFEYNNEPHANNEMDYTIGKDGRTLNGATIIEKKKTADGNLEVVTETKGKDGNEQKPCIFRTVIRLSYPSLIITKLVKFEGEKEFFQRNQYNVSR